MKVRTTANDCCFHYFHTVDPLALQWRTENTSLRGNINQMHRQYIWRHFIEFVESQT